MRISLGEIVTDKPDWATIVAEGITNENWRYCVAIKLRKAFEDGRVVGFEHGHETFKTKVMNCLNDLRLESEIDRVMRRDKAMREQRK